MGERLPNASVAKRFALHLALVGVVAQLVGFVLNALTSFLAIQRLASAFALLISLGGAAVVGGCVRLAQAKGHPWYLGLLGFFSFVGVAILHFAVPDRTV